MRSGSSSRNCAACKRQASDPMNPASGPGKPVGTVGCGQPSNQYELYAEAEDECRGPVRGWINACRRAAAGQLRSGAPERVGVTPEPVGHGAVECQPVTRRG